MKTLRIYMSLVLAAVVMLPALSRADFMSSTTNPTGGNNSGTNDSAIGDTSVTTTTTVTDNNVQTAAGGYCPVCLANGKKVLGDDSHTAFYKGKKYMFDSDEDRRTFIENPDKYTQDLGSKV